MSASTKGERMVPLMAATLIVLGAFFFAASLWQLINLNQAAQNAPGLEIGQIEPYLENLAGATTLEQQQAIQRALLTSLELDVTTRRHYYSRVFLQASMWVKYLGFVTGMILAVVGSVFVLGRLRAPETEIDAEVASMTYRIKSASPGIILAVLGVALMISTMAIRHTAYLNDGSVYISEESLGIESTDKPEAAGGGPAQSHPSSGATGGG